MEYVIHTKTPAAVPGKLRILEDAKGLVLITYEQYNMAGRLVEKTVVIGTAKADEFKRLGRAL